MYKKDKTYLQFFFLHNLFTVLYVVLVYFSIKNEILLSCMSNLAKKILLRGLLK